MNEEGGEERREMGEIETVPFSSILSVSLSFSSSLCMYVVVSAIIYCSNE